VHVKLESATAFVQHNNSIVICMPMLAKNKSVLIKDTTKHLAMFNNEPSPVNYMAKQPTLKSRLASSAF
jgi:hypothetical protein